MALGLVSVSPDHIYAPRGCASVPYDTVYLRACMLLSNMLAPDPVIETASHPRMLAPRATHMGFARNLGSGTLLPEDLGVTMSVDEEPTDQLLRFGKPSAWSVRDPDRSRS